MAQRRHVFRRVVGLVFAHGDATTGRLPPGPQHRFRGPAFGRAIGLRHPAGDRQPVPVLHAGVAHKESFVSRPAAFRYSRLSGSVTLAWVSFSRCWPRKLVPSVSSLPSLGSSPRAGSWGESSSAMPTPQSACRPPRSARPRAARPSGHRGHPGPSDNGRPRRLSPGDPDGARQAGAASDQPLPQQPP
jgi:hypothetical protein